MRAFHIDFNTHHFNREYLEMWLMELSEIGYDTIIWEIENAVELDSIPECNAPDAFTRSEFRAILDFSRKLGLEPIPLLQTLGHVEYILKHEKYRGLSERPESFFQFCPSNPKVAPFVRKIIADYLDLFEDLRYFHIGADESWWLGECKKCAAFVKKNSKSELYVRHVNAVVKPLLQKKITPCIWSDMLLTYPEALGKLSRKILQFDWNYWDYDGRPQVWVWGQGRKPIEECDPEAVQRFYPYMFPRGDEPGREAEPFYTSDYLAAERFNVVVCPSSASHGDSVFTPRSHLHLANTFSAFRRAQHSGFDGAVLTSWTVRIHPWECQLPIIDAPGFLMHNPRGTLEDFEHYFTVKRFGIDDVSFFDAIGLLSKPVLFSDSSSLGINKTVPAVPEKHVMNRLRKIKSRDVDGELEKAKERLEEYRAGKKMLDSFRRRARKGYDWLEPWNWAAKNLVHRAETVICLLEWKRLGLKTSPAQLRAKAEKLLKSLKKLETETDEFFGGILKPTRAGIEVGWLYDSVEYALSSCAGRR